MSEKLFASIVGFIFLVLLIFVFSILDPYEPATSGARVFLSVVMLVVMMMLAMLNLQALSRIRNWISSIKVFRFLYILIVLVIVHIVLASIAFTIYRSNVEAIVIDRGIYDQNFSFAVSRLRATVLRYHSIGTNRYLRLPY